MRRRGPSLAPLIGRLLTFDLTHGLRRFLLRLRLEWHRIGTKR